MEKYLSILTFFFLFTTLFAETEPKQEKTFEKSFRYWDFGGGVFPLYICCGKSLVVPFLNFGMGQRWQKDHFGADVAFDLSTLVLINQLKFSSSLLYYFGPHIKSPFYVGAGIDFATIFCTNERPVFYLTPSFTFGKEWQNKNKNMRFVQASVNCPEFVLSYRDNCYIPVFYLKFGFGF